MKTIHRSSKGFTIIEVSLVLAIAGLIFVMIFVALPALQRQSRDTKRREDTLTLIGAIKKYQQNNRGALPENSNWDNFYAKYLGDNFHNPEGKKYSLEIDIGPCESSDSSQIAPGQQCGYYEFYANELFENKSGDWIIYTNATCQDNTPRRSSNPRNVAVIVQLESGTYCANT